MPPHPPPPLSFSSFTHLISFTKTNYTHHKISSSLSPPSSEIPYSHILFLPSSPLPMYFLRPLLLSILLLTISFSLAQEEEQQGEEIELTEASPYQTAEIELETPQPFQTFDIEVDDATNSIDDKRRDDIE